MTSTIQNLHLQISIHPIAQRETPDEESGDDMSILMPDSKEKDSKIEFSEGSDDQDD